MWANKKAISPKMKKLGVSNINKVSPAADNNNAAMSFNCGLPLKLIKYKKSNEGINKGFIHLWIEV